MVYLPSIDIEDMKAVEYTRFFAREVITFIGLKEEIWTYFKYVCVLVDIEILFKITNPKR